MKNELKKLIADYKKNAEKHGIGTNEGNYKLANKSHDRLIKALLEIRKAGDDGDVALLALTDDPNKSVRCWAATHSLKYDKQKSENTLREIMEHRGLIGFGAKMVLSEWEKGTLKIP